ncbi:unnamed protein product, partial [Didymodactylos carnosus]
PPSTSSPNLDNTAELADADNVENTNVTELPSATLLLKIRDTSCLQLILSAINQRNTIIDLKSYRDSGYICCVLTEYNYLKKVEEQSSASSPRFLSFCMLPVNMSSLIELSESRYLELIKGDATPKHELLYYINRNGKKPGIAISLNKADKLINDLKKNEIPLNKIDLIVFNVCTRRQAATKMFTSSNGEDEIQSYKKLMTHI